MENNLLQTDEPTQLDYLANLEDPYFQQVHATTGQRFLNFLIDNVFMRFAMSYLMGMILGIILALVAPELLTEVNGSGNYWAIYFIVLLVAYLDYIIYYTLCEKLFKGYTLGKLITGTRAVKADGTELTFKDCVLRSLCRIVPFEMFSGFGGHPWHDKWTDTIVIKTR